VVSQTAEASLELGGENHVLFRGDLRHVTVLRGKAMALFLKNADHKQQTSWAFSKQQPLLQ
jgi:hypothetical protein